MPFIKGAWIDISRGDERYHDYFCCPTHGLMNNLPEDLTINPYYSCGLSKGRKIQDWDYPYRPNIIIPDWCPLREKKMEGEK